MLESFDLQLVNCVASECLVTRNSGLRPSLIFVDPRHTFAWMNVLPPILKCLAMWRLASPVLFTTIIVSFSWSLSVSEGRQGPCWSGRDPEQPERPHGDTEHLPPAAEPERTGEKPVWAWHCIEFFFLHYKIELKFKKWTELQVKMWLKQSSTSNNKPFHMESHTQVVPQHKYGQSRAHNNIQQNNYTTISKIKYHYNFKINICAHA